MPNIYELPVDAWNIIKLTDEGKITVFSPNRYTQVEKKDGKVDIIIDQTFIKGTDFKTIINRAITNNTETIKGSQVLIPNYITKNPSYTRKIEKVGIISRGSIISY
jgi:hypothetical protein